MARPNKSPAFTIYEDASGAVPAAEEQQAPPPSTPAKSAALDRPTYIEEEEEDEEQDGYEDLDADLILEDALDLAERERYAAAEISRRISAMTGTSVSSLPDSLLEVDLDHTLPMHEPYSPPLVRPSFRRPESVRRMQMNSPPPHASERSPRRPTLYHTRSRTGTPRSGRRSSLRGTPRGSVHLEEETETEGSKKDFPLVLLHVTLLPIKLSWSLDIIEDTLPPKMMDRCRLLKSKITDTILQRGILIPHPQEDYELLEERILEALELIPERVTKCGHFQARDSTSSTASIASARDSDSGLGSSLDEPFPDACSTCQHALKLTDLPATRSASKWTVKVFAANGLMRASAWATAWSEMERIDVEILPTIDEDMRRQLDARMHAHEAAQRLHQQAEDARVQDMMASQLLLVQQQRAAYTPSAFDASSPHRSPASYFDAENHIYDENPLQSSPTPQPRPSLFSPSRSPPSPPHSPSPHQHPDPYPAIYPRPADIPLSLLLKNYIYLLAQDRKNVVILALSALALWMALLGATTARKPPFAVLASPLESFDAVHHHLLHDSPDNAYFPSAPGLYPEDDPSNSTTPAFAQLDPPTRPRALERLDIDSQKFSDLPLPPTSEPSPPSLSLTVARNATPRPRPRDTCPTSPTNPLLTHMQCHTSTTNA